VDFLLVDTSVVVDLWRGQGKTAAMTQLDSAVKGISIVTLGELKHGLKRHPLNPANTASFMSTINAYLIVPIDQETTDHWAELKFQTESAGDPKSANDLWIAATSLRLECALAHLDRDFETVPGIHRIGSDGVENRN
jgi:predicted nucleic acid-binding protein